MHTHKLIAAGGIVAAVALFLAIPAAAGGDDLNCGDPGTSHNMPIDPNNDPHNLDGDDDGVGCEDPSAFPTTTTTTTAAVPATTTTTAAREAPPADDTASEAPTAAPVQREPSYTG